MLEAMNSLPPENWKFTLAKRSIFQWYAETAGRYCWWLAPTKEDYIHPEDPRWAETEPSQGAGSSQARITEN